MDKREKQYYESIYTMASLNHCECVGEENLGWTKGVLSDGVPFEAELWVMDDELTLCVMIPEIFKNDNMAENNIDDMVEQSDEVSIHERMESCILKIGTYDRGYVEDFNTIVRYVEYLEEFGLVIFCGNGRNGGIHLLRDKEGNDIAGVIITLNAGGEVYAETPLVFKNFHGVNQRIFMYKKMHI